VNRYQRDGRFFPGAKKLLSTSLYGFNPNQMEGRETVWKSIKSPDTKLEEVSFYDIEVRLTAA